MEAKISIGIAVCFWMLATGGEARAAAPTGRTTEVACAPSRAQVVAAIVDGWVWTTLDGGEIWKRLARVDDLTEEDTGDDDSWGDFLPEEGVIPGREEGDLFHGFESDAFLPEVDLREDGGGAAARTSLAVGDDGRWSVVGGGVLVTGGPGPGVERVVILEDPSSALFGPDGRIWVVASDRLHVVEGGVITGSWAVHGTGVIARGSGSGQILIPCRDGLRVMDTRHGADETAFFPLGGVEATSAIRGSEGWIAAVRGKLITSGKGGQMKTSPGFPFTVRRLVIDGGGGILAEDGAGTWWSRSGAATRPATILGADVDALGRLWSGTSTGPLAPVSGPSGPVDMALERMGPMMDDVAGRMDDFPAQPPCPVLPLNPLPAMRVIAGFGRGDGVGYGFPAPARTDWARTWLYVGVKLIWDLDPVSPTACVAAREQWARTRTEAGERVGRLWIEWRKATARREVADDPLQSFIAANEAEKAAQLLRILSESDP